MSVDIYFMLQEKHNCTEVDSFNTTCDPAVNKDGNEKYDYNITGLQPYTNYTVAISCVNINGTRQEKNITVQTNSTAPGQVENLHIHQFPENLTSVEVFFSCPNETERHGDIEYYTLSYDAQGEYNDNVTENTQGLNISVEPESNCNYSQVVPVTAQVDYRFSVRAFNKYNGTVSEKNYTTLTGASGPVASLDVLSTTPYSITIQWTRPSLPNGNILGYQIDVISDGNPDQVINVTCHQPNSECGEKHNCTEVDSFNTTCDPAVNEDGNEKYDYYITGLQPYTNYTVAISCVNINGTGEGKNTTVQTNSTAPGQVENLHIHQFPENFTSVEVFFSCPNETERHGDIEYYTLSYDAQGEYNDNVTENTQGLNISVEPESNCNYSQVVPVTAQVDYRFSVRAFNKYNGTVSEKNYTTLTGASGPVASLDVLSTTPYSITIQWTRPSLPNGNILGYQITVPSDDKSERVINVTCVKPEVGGEHVCKAVDTSNTSSEAVVNHDGNKQYDYNITALKSYTDYTIVISCVNINGTGEETKTSVQTNITVPSPPEELRAFVNSSSSVTLIWSPAVHQDGPTTYYIRVGEETQLNLDSFKEKEIVTVGGFDNTSVLVEGLRSYWKYTFNITAATPVGNSSVVSLIGTVRTNESAPGKVENLHINLIQDNFTSVEVFFSCPNETERHGDIKYYILSYEAQGEYNHHVTENPQRFKIPAERESNCNYSRVVPVTAQVDYMFSVQAFNNDNGTISVKDYTTLTGESGPVASLDVLKTTAHSITIQWTKPSRPNGNILGYLITVTSDNKRDQVIHVTCDQPKVGGEHVCKAVDTSNTSSVAVVNHDGNKQYDYNITALKSYTDYTIVISCVNINGTGEEKKTSVQTNITVPSPPKKLRAFVNSSSSVTLIWSPAVHQDGPTTYYIRVGEETQLNLDSFEEKEIVTVTGFHNTSVLVEGLRSYWNYNFSITAATPVGNSSVVSLNRTVRTEESAPGKVENLHIAQIPGNFTSLEVFFSCPNETERHGDIKYYILSYIAQGEYTHNVTANHKGLNISAQKSNCNYSRVVPVTAEAHYMFLVVAHDSYAGNETTEYHVAKVGQPGNVSDFTCTSTSSSSISLSWKPPRFPNGFILGYVLHVHTEDGACQQAVYIVCTDCQSNGNFSVEDENCNISRRASIQRPETSLTNYNVTFLLSFSNYTITVAAVNNFSIGINTSLAMRTDIDVPAMPTQISVTVFNASAVKVTWTPPDQKSGPTNYTILVQQATGRQSSTFENMENVTVNGYSSSERTIGGLWSSWRYKFSIIASTYKGGSRAMVSERYITTQESKPCEVQNLSVSSIPGNFRAVNLTWDCPMERERNGFINNYTIQYYGPGALPTVYGHYEPEDPCNATHTAILPVRPEYNYTFNVSANAMYKGKTKQSNVFPARAGKPLTKTSSEIFISTAAQSKDVATDTSFTVSFDSTTLLDDTNGKIIEAGILVMKKNEKTSKRPENMTDWDTWKNWYKWKNCGYKGSYRPTPEHYLIHVRKRRSASTGESLMSYSVGVDVKCDSEQDQFCNGPLEPETMYQVVAVSCTRAGCTSTDPFGNFKTEPTPIVGAVVGGIVAAVVVIGVVVGVVLLRRRRRRKSHDGNEDNESEDDHEAEDNVDNKTMPKKIADFNEIVKDLYKDSKLLFTREWQQLAAATVKQPSENAVLVGNRSKNRYVNILAYDHSRVKLLPLDEDECSDYINANYIPGYTSPREYIASQGPLSQTTVDFWRMIWEQKVPLMVMLTGLMEGGVRKLDMYWPEEMNAPKQYGDLVVELINMSALSKFTIMIFNMTLGNDTRTVKHFFLPGWHDYNANLDEGDVIDFARYVRAELKPTDEGPMLVHCSAGVGRTGTYLSVDYFIQVIDNCDIDGEVDIFSYVLKMRNNRPFMVQSEKQYVFIHDAVKEMIARKKKLLFGEQEENIYQNQGFVPDEADGENLYMNVVSGAQRM
ncbi:receptor-type tyrosine-protein phosphatase eta-like [Haliotis cracherodii]|uniref:receptor-type tyrosine-protein phosphatase eta-like n=1 Tax=Haliotis cracherodii TaxID=6455 RepID=UPI0039EB768C